VGSFRIFLSYRRQDASGTAGRLYDALAREFSGAQLFMDTHKIEPGADYIDVITRAVGSCDVVLALIGPKWVGPTGAGERRIDDPADGVRNEIETAFGHGIRVIPVLLQGARFPTASDLPASLHRMLATNAVELSDHRWRDDAGRLIRVLKNVQAERSGHPGPTGAPQPIHAHEGTTASAPRSQQVHPPDVVLCPGCGEENPARFQLCGYCGTPLHQGSTEEERKVVTVLFCDLVGFTASSDMADPEDVRARLRPYFARLRYEIESFGGTVEKFIGDAVMAVFGAPTAHEDDPERAVRAGLAIIDAISDLNDADSELDLQVRVGIETGEAVVALGAGLQRGEGIATGDVVNTASRLQGVAPINGVVVGEGTYGATEGIFEYRVLDPVTLKGKAAAVPIFHATRARARFGTDLTRAFASPLVGREPELHLATAVFERSVHDARVQILNVVGEAGVGKSRLVAELGEFVDTRPELVRWRQGRCLPYGDAVTFWALGEIVKAEAGILETDSPDEAGAKIDASVRGTHPDGPWLRQRLRPLVGIQGPQAAREENFAAWRAYLESLAEDRPSVFVIDDLHWADDALLAFLEHLAEYAEGVPMLLVATARPELFDRLPGFLQGARNSHRIDLVPLGSSEMARLISILLNEAELSGEVQDMILARAGGNPLYAEEFVRLLKDRGILGQRGSSWTIDDDAEIPLPSGVRGLIAARLDTLSPSQKRLLQDAAVVGKVFWSGALAAMGDESEDQIRDVLHQLTRREFLRPARVSSMEGEVEFAFSHALVRDVCYAQIPRAQRAERHQRAAAWIERIASGRVEDHAEILAAHYAAALQLVTQSRDRGGDELKAKAVRYLLLAGDRAIGMNVEVAERHYSRALDLLTHDDPDRPDALARHGAALFQRGRYAEASQALEDAIVGFEASGDVEAEAATKRVLGKVLVHTNPPRARELSAESLAMLEPLRPSAATVRALADEAHVAYVTGDNDRAVSLADRALQLAADLGLPEPPTALQARGGARAVRGELDGVEDLRRGLAAAERQGLGREVAIGHLGLAYALGPIEGTRPALEIQRAGLAFAERRGIEELAPVFQTSINDCLIDLGLYDEAVTACNRLAPTLESAGDLWNLTWVRSTQALIGGRRGRASEYAGAAEWAGQQARAWVSEEPQFVDVFSVQARIRLALGDTPGALAVLSEVVDIPRIREEPQYMRVVPEMVSTALGSGSLDLATRLGEALSPVWPLHEHCLITVRAMLAEHRGELADSATLYADAAEGWERFEMPWERAQTRLGLGRCCLALGRTGEAAAALREARDLFGGLGAEPTRDEADSLLTRAAADSS
jgi:class 3 adenylate cyclase/tetratricopeptide (TPR) repeat protein